VFHQKIILLSGPLAVGKTSVRDELVLGGGFQSIRSSAYLKQVADGDGGRRTLQEVGDRLDLETEYRWLIDCVASPAFQADPQRTKWLVDAVRKERQVAHFRNTYGASAVVFHAHLYAAEPVLKRRFENRQRASGDKDVGTYEAAIDHDNERSARALIDIADKVYDTGADLPKAVADRILADVCAYGSNAIK
jgi:hypothetical protein